MEDQILSSAILTSLLLLVFTVVLLRFWRRPSNPPPGPWKFPVIGNIHNLIGRQLPHSRLRDMAKEYGSIIGLQLGQISTVIISSAEMAKQVLKTQELQFIERPSVLAVQTLLYNRTDIIFAPYGDYWRQMRKIAILELLSSKRVQSSAFKSVREEEVSNLIKFLYSKQGSPVNLSTALMPLINGIIAKSSVGKKFKQQEELIRVVSEANAVAGGFNVADFFPSFKFLHNVSGISSRLQKIHQDVDKILEEIINENKINKVAMNEADNVLDVLLDIQQHGNLEFPITTDNIKAIILEMFAAASDTSAVALEWGMSEMIKNPRIMKKAQEEVRLVVKGQVDEASLHELKYLKLIIKETLRLHPPLTLIVRECCQKCQISGYDIFPKTKVLVNAWAIGRDPNSWSDPEKFYPERFASSSVDFKGTDFEFIPFGAGKRMCPGITMAMANIELILAQLLYHFNWELPAQANPETLDMSESSGNAVKRKVDLSLIPTSNPV